VAGVTTVPLATLNGVWAYEVGVETDVIEALLDRVAANRSAYCLQARAAAARSVAELAASRGMGLDEDIPLMVVERGGEAEEISPGALTIKELSPEEGHQHAVLAAAGFGAPEEYFLELANPALMRLPGTRYYLGAVDGEPVTTGLGYRYDDCVGIFNIATPSAHRRRGYGAAVTMRAVHDGFSAGASWAWLQSSPEGFPVYERLGFRTVESWRCWVSSE
jgi:ribosomal protein S18 acetylase RimI-like enzyme